MIHDGGEKTEGVIGHPTPGPWHVLLHSEGDDVLNVIAGDTEAANTASGCTWIAELDAQHVQTVEENEANAHLIAAAPDMLAALDAAINWFTPPNDSGPFPLKQITDAIAKATGTTP